MSIFFIYSIIVFLSIQVFPIAIGINVSGKPVKALKLILVISLTQLLTYWLGLKLGDTFMYLMDGFSSVVLFIIFLLIGIRMLMEVFNIRKGERTYTIDWIGHVALASTAQGVNSFLVGLVYYYIDVNENHTIIALLSATLFISIVGVFLKPGKLTFALASLLYTIGGLIMILAAIYFSFFYN